MESRAEALQNVESTIVELSGIFQQLATMVAEQGELAVRIDDNVDDTLANVESAQSEVFALGATLGEEARASTLCQCLLYIITNS